MKKFYFIPAAAMALALAACSSDDVLAPEGNGPQWNAEGKGYVSLAINLPKEKASLNRSSDNDQFENGTPEEYDVKKAVLLVFGGDSEAAATLQGGYKLTLPTFGNGDGNQITSTVQLVQAINQAPANNLYALVILNPDGVLTVGEDNSVSVGGANFTGTFADFKTKTMSMAKGDVTSIAGGNNGFLMLNAPLASAVGAADWTGTVSTLAPLEDKVYPTEAEAASNPATSVYVERAVAKVEVTANATEGTLGAEEGALAWEIKGWVLNNTNTTSYLVRNTNTDDEWWGYQNGTAGFRFIGTSQVKTGAGFRTYWAQDPNYGEEQTGLYSPWYDANPAEDDLKAVGSVAYCLENTFDVAHQNQNLTTTVVVAAQLGDGSDFFTLNGTSTTLYTRAELDKAVKSAFLNTAAVKTALEENADGKQTFDENDIAAITYSKSDAGEWTVTGVTYSDAFAGKFVGDEVPATLQADGAAYTAGLSNATGLKINCYADGVAYYPVLVKHFGDDLTPWSQQGTEAYPGPNAAGNWLGRYGVLRNNWYKVNVTGISNIGSSTVPEIKTPDDPTQSYIAVEINVLSWAVRSQSVDL